MKAHGVHGHTEDVIFELAFNHAPMARTVGACAATVPRATSALLIYTGDIQPAS